MKDERDEPAASLQPVLLCLFLQQGFERGREREASPSPVPRGARIEPHDPPLPVDLSPFERQDLASPSPAGHVGEVHDRHEWHRQVTADCLKLACLEEPAPPFGRCPPNRIKPTLVT
jgi:hypothetical protein